MTSMPPALRRLFSTRRVCLRSVRRSLVLAVVAGTVLPASAPWVRTAIAEPRGAQVVAGNVNISQHGNRTIIRASNGSIINFQQFNINPGETVRFIQPNAQSRVLNRITGNAPTLIQGSLFANGQVYFINPAGITFSRGAVVNVGGIIAAAANISDADFASGTMRFTGAAGQVLNDTTITGSMVGLIGRQVINTGTIQTGSGGSGGAGGWVVMAAGDEVFVGEAGRRVMVKVDPNTVGPQTPGVGVHQAGTIDARNGRVDLAAGDLYSSAMRISGVTTAGQVRAQAMGRGSVEVSGTIDASNQGASGRGGRVEILGRDIALSGATIDARGTTGGGEIRIGGEAHGASTLPAAETVRVSSDSTLLADTTGTGSGGSIVMWSSALTEFSGSASADSAEGSRGGFIETSSAGRVLVDSNSIHARGGLWLLDPAGDIFIGLVDPLDGSTFVSLASVLMALDAGTDVTQHAANNLIVATAITKSAGGDCTLELRAGINVDIRADIRSIDPAGRLNLNLFANTPVMGLPGVTGSVIIDNPADGNPNNDPRIDLNGGSFHVLGLGYTNTNTTSFAFANIADFTFELSGDLGSLANFATNGASFTLLARSGAPGITLSSGLNIDTRIAADNATGAAVTIGTDIDALAHGVSIFSGIGKISISGVLTNLTTLSLSSANVAADAISVAGISTSGAQNYTGNTTLTGTYTITGAASAFTVTGNTILAGDTAITTNDGGISFLKAVGDPTSGTINSDATARSLTLDAGAGAVFTENTIGGVAQLSRLVATGSTINVVSVKTVGDGSMNPSQLYTGATTLFGSFNTANTDLVINGNVTLSANPMGGVIVNAGSGDIIINGGVNGSGSQFNLTLNSSALTRITGNISSVGNLTTDGGGGVTDLSELGGTVATTKSLIINDDTTLSGASYATTGSQSFARTVNINGASAVTFSATDAAAGITFTGDYAGGSQGLTANTNAGVVAFGGNVSGVAALATTTGASGSTTFADATTVGADSFTINNGSTIGAGTILTAANGNLHLIGASTIGDGAELHADTGTGALSFDAATSFLGGATLTAKSFLAGGTVGIGSGGTLSVDTSATGGSITFSQTVSGPGGLSLNSGMGKIALSVDTGTGMSGLASLLATSSNAAADAISVRSVSTAGVQTYTGNTTLAGSTYSTTNSAFLIDGNTALGATAVVSSGSAASTFDGTITGTAFGLTVNSTGLTSFHDNIDVGSLATNSGGQTAIGRVSPPDPANAITVTTHGTVSIGDNLVLRAGSYTFNSTAGSNAANRAMTFGGTITKDSPSSVVSLLLEAGAGIPLAANRGNITVTGAVGAVGAEFASFQANGNIVTINGALTNVGGQMFSGVDVILNGLYNTGSQNFTATGSSIRLTGNTSVVTTGNATFTGPLFLQGNNLAVNADGLTSFVNAISGLGALSTNAAGTTEFHGTVDVGSMAINDAATLFGATATTAGDMTFFAGLALETGVTLTSTTGDIRLLGAVDGNGSGMTANNLTLNTSNGHLALIDAGATDIAQLRSGPNGKVQVRATGSPILVSLLNFQNDLELLGTNTQTVTFDSSGVNGSLAVGKTITGATNLSLLAGNGTITLDGAASGLRSIVASGGTLNINSLSTLGDQTLTGSGVNLTGATYAITGGNSGVFSATGPVVFVGNAARTMSTDGGAINFSSSVTGGAGANNLTLNTIGDTTFGGIVTGLGALASNAGGATIFMDNVSAASLAIADTARVHGTSITTSGAQTYSAATGNALELFNDVTLSGVGISMNTVLGNANATDHDLIVSSSGTTSFLGDVSGVDELSTSASGDGTTIAGGMTLAVRQATFGDEATLGSNTHVNATGTDALVMFMDSAELGSQAGVSATAAGAHVTFMDSAELGDQTTVSVSGAASRVDFMDAATLSGDSATVTASSGAEAVRFDSTVNGNSDLTVNSTGAAIFDGAVGGSSALSSLDVDGSTITVHNARTIGNQAFAGALTLMGNSYQMTGSGGSFQQVGTTTLGAASTTVHSFNGDIMFSGGAINGACDLTLSASADGSHVMLMSDAGMGTALTRMRASGSEITLHSVRTETGQTYSTFSGAEMGGGMVMLMGSTYEAMFSDVSQTASTAGAFILDGHTMLGNNATVQTGTGFMIFTGSINDMSAGMHSLSLVNTDAISRSTNPLVRFGGNIGQTTALGALSFTGTHGTSILSAPGKPDLTRDNATILFASGLINADGTIGAIAAEPTASFIVNAQNGFSMSASDRLMSYGDLTINGSSALLSWMTVLGELAVNTSSVSFQNGANIVASKGMTFTASIDPGVSAAFGINPESSYIGSGVPFFLARTLNRSLTFMDFNSAFLTNVTIADGGIISSSLMLMQPAEGVTASTVNEFSISPVISDSDTVRRYQPGSVGSLADGLREFNLDLRDLDPEELSEFFVGRSIYTDLPLNVPAKASESRLDFQVTRNRLEPATLNDALQALDRLLGPKKDNVREKARPRGAEFAASWVKYRESTEEPTVSGFKAFVAGNPDFAGTSETFADLELVMTKVRAMALSPQETRIVRSAVITQLAKANNKVFLAPIGKPASPEVKAPSLSELLLRYFDEPTQVSAR